MKINYFGVENAVIDERFKDYINILELVLDSKSNILFNNTYPCISINKNNQVVYYPRNTIIDNDLDLSIEEIYNYGVIYKIINKDDKVKTSAKIIVGNNLVSFIIDDIDYDYNDKDKCSASLKNNLDKEEVLKKSLGERINIEKLWGVRRKNRVLKLFEDRQIESEMSLVENAVLYSMDTLEESINPKSSIRIRK